MILVRLVLYLSLAAPFGISLFALANPRVLQAVGIRLLLIGCVAVAMVVSTVWLDLVAAQMAGAAAWPADPAGIGIVLNDTAVGTSWIVRMAALVVACVAAASAGTRAAGLAVCGTASGLALVTPAWAGHGAIDDGAIGRLHLTADMLHLLASGVWVGALLSLTLLLTRPRLATDPALLRAAHRALRGFGPVGTAVVGLLVATGAVQTWLLVGPGGFAAPWATTYGSLLLAKLFLFGLMLALAAVNRFRLTPALARAVDGGDVRLTMRALRISLAAETGLAVTILAIVAWLGTLAPPIART